MEINTINIIILASALILAGISEAIMDKLQFHYNRSIFARFNDFFWKPTKSWVNKYKVGADGVLLRGKNGEYVPRFWGSTTWLVWTTDAWHLFQTIRNFFLRGALAYVIAGANVPYILLCFAVITLLFSGAKEIFFKYIFEHE